MATPWLKRIKETGQLTVFNKATAWADSVNAAIRNFNNLSLGVQMIVGKEEKAANIVVVLANGSTQYQYYGDTAKTKPDFKADILHGQASTLIDTKRNAIFFAAIFLPGRVKATAKQKEVVVVHELIHACGMDEHDTVGVMYGQMMEHEGGLIEYLHDKGAKPMPPIRIGTQTACIMRMLWAGGGVCKDG